MRIRILLFFSCLCCMQEDAMRSYLSGLIVPLTPSTRPTNVEHLARREEQTVPTSCTFYRPGAIHPILHIILVQLILYFKLS